MPTTGMTTREWMFNRIVTHPHEFNIFICHGYIKLMNPVAGKTIIITEKEEIIPLVERIIK